MAKTKSKKGGRCLNGIIPRNKFDYEGSVLLLHPEIGFIKIAFGDGGNFTDEDEGQHDEKGNLCDQYMYITTFNMRVQDDVWYPGSITAAELKQKRTCDRPGVSGILFQEEDGGCMLFSTRTHSGGSIIPMIRPCLDFLGWPTELEEYVFISKED